MTHETYMRLAIALAEKNVHEANGGPFGAVIVKDGEIVAQSANMVTCTNDPTAHAEMTAIRIAAQKLNTFNLSGCVIYTSCEPCPMCLGAIYWARISKIYYAGTKHAAAQAGFDDKFIYDEMEVPAEKRMLPSEQMLQDEAVRAFTLWIRSGRKIEY